MIHIKSIKDGEGYGDIPLKDRVWFYPEPYDLDCPAPRMAVMLTNITASPSSDLYTRGVFHLRVCGAGHEWAAVQAVREWMRAHKMTGPFPQVFWKQVSGSEWHWAFHS